MVKIEVPALRERKNDIPLVASEFLKEFCARENKILRLSPQVMRLFQGYSWPGNIRQLRNIMERAVVLAQGQEITEHELSEELTSPAADRPARQASTETLKEMEARAIREALATCGGNKSRAARLLGFSRKALYKRLKDFDIA